MAEYTVAGAAFRAGKPRHVSDVRFVERRREGPTRSFDLHPDGKRFAMTVDATSETKRDRVSFVLGVFDELRSAQRQTRR